MRDFKGMKRQRGRNRGGGGGKPQQNANRAFDSNGPDGVKVRGNAQHVFEKYQQLARDAASAGDRVLAENYLQHAEHYFRLLRAIQPQRPPSEILGRDQFASGYDIDFEDESAQGQSEAAEDGAQDGEGRDDGDGQGQGQRREWQNRDNRDGRDREGRDNRDRENRDRDRDRGEGAQGGGQGGQGGQGGESRRDRRDRWRDRRDRDGRDRDDRPRGEGEERREGRDEPRRDRPERDPLPVVEPQGDRAAERGPVLRDAEGGESQAPAFLQARPEPRPEAAEGEERPRRRRRPRSFEAGETGGGSEEA